MEAVVTSLDNLTVRCVEPVESPDTDYQPICLHIIQHDNAEQYRLTIPHCHQFRVRVWVREDLAVSLKVTIGDIKPNTVQIWFDSRYVVIKVT